MDMQILKEQDNQPGTCYWVFYLVQAMVPLCSSLVRAWLLECNVDMTDTVLVRLHMAPLPCSKTKVKVTRQVNKLMNRQISGVFQLCGKMFYFQCTLNSKPNTIQSRNLCVFFINWKKNKHILTLATSGLHQLTSYCSSDTWLQR